MFPPASYLQFKLHQRDTERNDHAKNSQKQKPNIPRVPPTPAIRSVRNDAADPNATIELFHIAPKIHRPRTKRFFFVVVFSSFPATPGPESKGQCPLTCWPQHLDAVVDLRSMLITHRLDHMCPPVITATFANGRGSAPLRSSLTTRVPSPPVARRHRRDPHALMYTYIDPLRPLWRKATLRWRAPLFPVRSAPRVVCYCLGGRRAFAMALQL